MVKKTVKPGYVSDQDIREWDFFYGTKEYKPDRKTKKNVSVKPYQESNEVEKKPGRKVGSSQSRHTGRNGAAN